MFSVYFNYQFAATSKAITNGKTVITRLLNKMISYTQKSEDLNE
jgi:hypothetical protein